MFIYSLINIIMWFIENKKNNNIKEEINKYVEINEVKLKDNEEKTEYTIDFSKLKERNADTVAYLKVNNTNIDYVVVKGSDNSYYLKHNFNKENNRAGWIFMDYHNKLDGNDKNIVIYGHNTLDGTMFGTLRNVVKPSWYENEENHIIKLVLENEVVTYQVFSTYSIKVEDYYINTIFKDNDEFDTFIKTLKKRSVYDYGVDVSGEDSILTLSTCTGNGKSRMVLHAKLLDLVA
jgi:sortase B